jgi:hypothetical protein
MSQSVDINPRSVKQLQLGSKWQEKMEKSFQKMDGFLHSDHNLPLKGISMSTLSEENGKKEIVRLSLIVDFSGKQNIS